MDPSKINQIETRKTTEEINKTKSWFFEKRNKIDKPLAKLSKDSKLEDFERRLKIRNKRGDIIPDITDIQRIMKDC